jgi:hypothetical protein
MAQSSAVSPAELLALTSARFEQQFHDGRILRFEDTANWTASSANEASLIFAPASSSV